MESWAAKYFQGREKDPDGKGEGGEAASATESNMVPRRTIPGPFVHLLTLAAVLCAKHHDRLPLMY